MTNFATTVTSDQTATLTIQSIDRVAGYAALVVKINARQDDETTVRVEGLDVIALLDLVAGVRHYLRTHGGRLAAEREAASVPHLWNDVKEEYARLVSD